MKKITLYHNPKCSKSRQALQLLLLHHAQPKIIEYLKTPLSSAKISQLLKLLKLTPRDLLRKNETVYKSLGLNDESLTDQTLITAMAENPILIERPIVVIDDKAVVARPPEKLLEIL